MRIPPSKALLAIGDEIIRPYGVDLPAFQAMTFRIGDAYSAKRSAPHHLGNEIIHHYGVDLPAFQALAFHSAMRISPSEALLAISAMRSSSLTAFIHLYGVDLPAFQALAFRSATCIPPSEVLLAISATRSSALTAFIRLDDVDLSAFQVLAFRIGYAYSAERSAPRHLGDEIIRPHGVDLPAFQALAFRSAMRIPPSKALLDISATRSFALTTFICLYGVDLPAFQAMAFRIGDAYSVEQSAPCHLGVEIIRPYDVHPPLRR